MLMCTYLFWYVFVEILCGAKHDGIKPNSMRMLTFSEIMMRYPVWYVDLSSRKS